jgi:hypothetical protein
MVKLLDVFLSTWMFDAMNSTLSIGSILKNLVKTIAENTISDFTTRQRFYLSLRILRHSKIWLSDPNLRYTRTRLISLRGVYRGQRCFVMGNGPSLNQTPLEKLANDHVWGANRCYLLFDQIEWRPAFIIAVDTRVVPDNAQEITDLAAELKSTSFFFPSHFRWERTLNSAPNIYWYHEISLDDNWLPEGHFSMNVESYVRSVRTVTIAALQIAVYLGFNPIYLIGCDTNYVLPESAIFEDQEQTQIVGGADNDPNHFSQDYFGQGRKYHQPYPEKMIFSYQQVKQVCDRLGIQIFNATVGGKLEIFPRVDINTLFD